jgi:hypothetical protein
MGDILGVAIWILAGLALVTLILIVVDWGAVTTVEQADDEQRRFK